MLDTSHKRPTADRQCSTYRLVRVQVQSTFRYKRIEPLLRGDARRILLLPFAAVINGAARNDRSMNGTNVVAGMTIDTKPEDTTPKKYDF